jgi:SHS2 domain-containing protein
MRTPIFREIEHTADKALEARGEDLPHLFESAAYGMFELMVELNTVEADREWRIELKSDSLEGLFASWLKELIFVSETDLAIPCQFDVAELGEWHLRATARGGRLGPSTVRKGAQVKAVTYHDLLIERDHQGWRATVTFDV